VTKKDNKVVFSIPGNTGIFATWAHSSLLENDKKTLEVRQNIVFIEIHQMRIIVTHFEQQESGFGGRGQFPVSGNWSDSPRNLICPFKSTSYCLYF
jgi:hypothetical protein